MIQGWTAASATLCYGEIVPAEVIPPHRMLSFLDICRTINQNQLSAGRGLVNNPIGVLLPVSMSIQWPLAALRVHSDIGMSLIEATTIHQDLGDALPVPLRWITTDTISQ
jgi:hypothetical protein